VTAPPLLEVRDVRKRYGQTVALDGVSFVVSAGEMFGLLGPNGAGKTTLLSIVSCLLEANSGAVYVQGRRAQLHDKDLRQHIAIVPQELAFYTELSARENLRFFGRLYGLTQGALEKRVKEVLAAIGLEQRADERSENFSGGMKRRLNLGVALVHCPRLLLLDEPTVGVDPQSRHHIFEEVRRLNKDGVTVIYTSHYMEEVQALCPRVGIMDNGKLVACDRVDTLLSREEGRIRFAAPNPTAELRRRLEQLPAVRITAQNAAWEVRCRDVKATLAQVMTALTDLHLTATSLEIEEPNLERIFLHLTGRELRD
jgi:ABC-2 type transport system ATP-binding protein